MRFLAKPLLLALTAVFPVMISACYGAPMEPAPEPIDALINDAKAQADDAEAAPADSSPTDAAGDAVTDAR